MAAKVIIMTPLCSGKALGDNMTGLDASGRGDLAKKRPEYQLDRDFYETVRAAKPRYQLLDRFIISPYTGRGFLVKKGQTFRVVEVAGPQIGDVAFWNAANPEECFGGMRTWLVEGWIIKLYTRLWSELPWFRPMMTCVEDTVTPQTESNYHHHFLGTHCAPETLQMGYGADGLNACRLNLLEAIEPFGLSETNLRENINVHEKDRLDPVTGRRSITRGDGKAGDYVEFFAEVDLLVAVSVCPFGDGSVDPTMYPADAVRPLGVEIYDTGIKPKPFPTWTEWRENQTASGSRGRFSPAGL